MAARAIASGLAAMLFAAAASAQPAPEQPPRKWISVAPDGTYTELKFDSDSSWVVSASLRVDSEARASQINQEMARVAEPESARLEAGESVASLVERRCGFADAGVQAAILELNAFDVMQPAPDARTVAVPPCVYFRKHAYATLAEGQTVSHLLMQATGYQGRETLKATRALNPQYPSLDRIPALATVTLPYATRDVAFRVKAEAAAGGPPSFVEASTNLQQGEMELVSGPAASDAPDDPAYCGPTTPNWPFDAAAVAATLARYAARGRPRSAAYVAVVDTGLPAGAEQWLPLARNINDEAAPPLDDADRNGYDNDLYGIDVTQNGGYPLAPPAGEYLQAAHGLAVASIASGRSTVPGTGAVVEVKALAVLKREFDAAGRARWFAAPATLSNAIDYVNSPAPIPSHVVNWSWEGASSDRAIETKLTSRQLFVTVAAGNHSRNLDIAAPSYPAAYTRVADSNVLAVAALRPDGQLAGFSNYGPGNVGIAAPGCAIPVLGPDGLTTTQSGTSFASPLVAYTAAVIESLGVTNLSQVRERILFTADRDPALATKVAQGRVLNVPLAVAIYDDIVGFRDGRPPLVGRLDADFHSLAGGGARSRARRIDFGKRDPTGSIPVTIQRQDDQLTPVEIHESCACVTMNVVPADGGPVQTFTGDDVAFVIPAYRILRN
jgi:hypothetical protein